jgi:hypothetical protein
MPDGVILKKHQGTSSGAITTSSDNTFAMFQILALAFYRSLTPAIRSDITPRGFMSLWKAKINGDDNIVGVRNDAEPYFERGFFASPEILVKNICALGVDYIPDGTMSWKEPDEISFLSSRPIRYQNRWVVIPADWDRFYTKLTYGKQMTAGQFLVKIAQDKARAIFDDDAVDVLEALFDKVLKEYCHPLDPYVKMARRMNLSRTAMRQDFLGAH